MQRSLGRSEAVSLVLRLMDGDYATEAEGDAILDGLRRGLGCPHVGDYLFWSTEPGVTAENVVDRAMAYEPFAP